MMYEAFKERYRFNVNDPAAKIGKGGFGAVYKAYDNLHNKWVAVKIVPVNLDQEKFSLMSEVETAKKLPDHPHIARYEHCYRFALPSGTYDYGVMQYYERGSLSELLKQQRLTLTQKEQVAAGILMGVDFLHQHYIIHRDLKSSNVLVAGYGEVVIPLIADFGLAKQIDAAESMVVSSFLGGTALYTSPEQLLGKSLRLNSDLWPLGVIVYELFAGELPFLPETAAGGNSQSHILQVIQKNPVPAHLHELPQPWQEICRRCLVADPTQRVQNTSELLGLLPKAQNVYEKTKVEDRSRPVQQKETKASGFSKPPASPPARSGLWVGVSAFLVGALGIAGYWWMNRPSSGAVTPTPPVVELPVPSTPANAQAQLEEVLLALSEKPASERLPFLLQSNIASVFAQELTYYYDFEGAKVSPDVFLSFLARKAEPLAIQMAQTDANGRIHSIELKAR